MKPGFIKPEYIKPHFSSKIWRAYHAYISKKYGSGLFTHICNQLNVPEEYLLSDDNWLSNQFSKEFMAILIKETGDQNIAEKVGQSTLNPQAINKFEYTILKSIPTFLFFILIPIQIKKLNRICKFTLTRLLPGRIKLQITPLIEETIGEHIFLSALGTIKSISHLYNFSRFDITPSKTKYGQNEIYNFEIRYSLSWRSKLKSIPFLFALLLGPTLAHSIDLEKIDSILHGNMQNFLIATYYLVVLLGYLLVRYFDFIEYNFSYHEQNRRKSEELYQQKLKLDRRYHESNLLRELSFRLVGEINPQKVISFCLDDLQKRFDYNKSMVMLTDSKDKKMKTTEIRGFNDTNKILSNLQLRFPADKASPLLFANILEAGKTKLIDLDRFKSEINPNNKKILDQLDVSSLIVSPIQSQKNKYGILIIGALGSERRFNEDDLHLIENVSRLLSLFFENAKSFQEEQTLRRVFQKYVPSAVLEELNAVDNQQSAAIEPKSTTISSMFIDLRGFTSSSENLEPAKVVDMLNTYADYVTHFIAQTGGIVDNLVGDGIVAFFPSGPNNDLNHSKNSLLTAIHILANIDQLNSMFANKGLPAASIGIGLHSGNATVGSVGCDRKMNYTAIGDTVNLASRLQTLGKNFFEVTPSAKNGLIVFSSEVLNSANLDIKAVNVGMQEIRGRKQTVDTWIIDLEQAKIAANLHAEGLLSSNSTSTQVRKTG